jgi:Na+/H+-dicarboxylate symporter
MVRKIPFVLVLAVCAILLFDGKLPLMFQQFLYSISLSIKEVMIMALPPIIFCLLFKSTVKLSSKATKIIAMIVILICCSDFISLILSHYVGSFIYKFDLSLIFPQDFKGLKPLWVFKLPRIISNSHAMFAGIILGILYYKVHRARALETANKIEHFVSKILQGILYLIPLFVIGFIVKMQHDGLIKLIIKDYAAIFAISALVQFSYIILVYFLINNCKIADMVSNLKNMMPAAISAFSTMSSAASMPLTIMSAEKNAKHKNAAVSVIPISGNIHLVGDCFTIPIFAYAVLKSFGVSEPSFMSYLVFGFYFILAKFSVAAVPGGGIIVMLPILQAYLGFNGEMLSLITALYILFDPVITCANVLGNGAFVRMIDKLLSK